MEDESRTNRSARRPLGALVKGAVAAVVVTMLGLAAIAQDACTLEDKRASVVVGFPAGSSDDLTVRGIQPFLEKHLPGNPTVTIENKAGAGGLLAANGFYNSARNDGTEIAMLTGFALRYALDDSAILFDIDEMSLLGVQPTNQVTLVANTLGIETPEDLLDVKEPLLIGTSSRRAAPFVANVMMMDLLGVPHKDLTGYQGQGAILQAIRTEELNVAPLAWDRYMSTRDSIEEEGLMHAVWQRGYLQGDGSVRPEPALNVPTQAEIVAKLRPDAVGTTEFRAMNSFVGLFSVTRSFWLPPEVDDCTTRMWRDALAAVYSDPEYRKMVKKQTQMDVVFYHPDEGKALFDSIFEGFADPEIRAIVDNIIAN